jgi:hypothetical protein
MLSFCPMVQFRLHLVIMSSESQLICSLFFVVLGIEPRTTHMSNKCSTSELHSQPFCWSSHAFFYLHLLLKETEAQVIKSLAKVTQVVELELNLRSIWLKAQDFIIHKEIIGKKSNVLNKISTQRVRSSGGNTKAHRMGFNSARSTQTIANPR